MADKIGEVYVSIEAKLDKLNAQLGEIKAKVERTARQTEQEFQKTRPKLDMSGVLGSLSAVTAAMAALKFAKDSLADWSKQEKASNRLAQALRNAGVAAMDLAAVQAEMEGFSTSLQKVTAYADETVTEVQALLVAMTGMTGRAVQPLTQAVLDLASGMEIDAVSAAKLVGKTLEGADALSKQGISTKGARSEAEKLDMIVKGVATSWGNFARNELNTLDGKMKHLSNQIGETRESFGQLLSQAITPMLPAIERLADFLGRMLLTAIISVKGKAAEMFSGAIAQIVYLYEIAKKIPGLGALGILGGDTIEKMKGWAADAAKIAIDAKAELDAILRPGHQGDKNIPLPGGGKGASTSRTLTDDEKKALRERADAALEAARDLQAAQSKFLEQGIKDEFDRRSMAAKNDYEDARRRLMDKANAEKMERRTLNDELLALYYEYSAELQKIDEAKVKKEQEENEKKLKAQQEMNEELTAMARDAGSIIDSEWSSALQGWISEGQNFTQATAHMWTNMANRMIEDIIRITTEWLLLKALLAIFPFLSPLVGAVSAIGGAGPAIPVAPVGAGGGGPIGTLSAGGGAGSMAGVEQRLDALNTNMAASRGGSSALDVNVHGQIAGQDIYLTDRKASRVYTRTR